MGGGAPEPAIGDDAGSVSVTADARTIVYTRGPDGLWKRDANGRTTQLVQDFANDVIVTPDDRNVLYVSFRSGIQAPWIVPLDGGEPREIVHAFTSVGSLRLARDGVHLFFVSGAGGWTICDLPDCANMHTVPFPENVRVGFQWTPDSADIAYASAPISRAFGRSLSRAARRGGSQRSRFPPTE